MLVNVTTNRPSQDYSPLDDQTTQMIVYIVFICLLHIHTAEVRPDLFGEKHCKCLNCIITAKFMRSILSS